MTWCKHTISHTTHASSTITNESHHVLAILYNTFYRIYVLSTTAKMSLPASMLPQQPEKSMKIQHTTYDESRDEPSGPSKKRLSTSMKVRTFISRRISQTFHSPPLPSHHEDTSTSENRPITQFPRFGESKHLTDEEKARMPDVKGYLVQNHRDDKATKKEERAFSRTSSNGNFMPLRSPTRSSSTKSKGFSIPSLKKKNTFSDHIKEKLNRRTEASIANSNTERTTEKLEEKVEHLVKAYNLRRAMQEGKLERVVPPPSTAISSGQNRRPPPRPAQNPFMQTSPRTFDLESNSTSPRASASTKPMPVSSKSTESPSSRTSLSSTRPTSKSRSRTRKTKSTSSKIASLIGNSADILDETRREIQGKFKEPFEHLGYPSFSLARKTGDHDGEGESNGDSDESFFCLGDREPGFLAVREGRSASVMVSVSPTGGTKSGTPSKGVKEREKGKDFYDIPRPKMRGKGSERRGSRINDLARGRARDVQISPPPEEVMKMCKLCGLGAASSYRGLCTECEADLSPLDPQNHKPRLDVKYSDSEYEDDIPLTLPLKVRKQALARERSVTVKNGLGPSAYKQRNPFAFEDSESDNEPPPPVPPKDDYMVGLSLSNKTYQPQNFGGQPNRQGSGRAKIEIQHETNRSSQRQPQQQSPTDRFSSWHSDSIDSPTLDEAQRILERWSECFGEGAVAGIRDMQEDGLPLVRAMDCDGVKRDSEFYKFWDGVLREHAPRSSGTSRFFGERIGPVREFWDG